MQFCHEQQILIKFFFLVFIHHKSIFLSLAPNPMAKLKILKALVIKKTSQKQATVQQFGVAK